MARSFMPRKSWVNVGVTVFATPRILAFAHSRASLLRYSAIGKSSVLLVLLRAVHVSRTTHHVLRITCCVVPIAKQGYEPWRKVLSESNRCRANASHSLRRSVP